VGQPQVLTGPAAVGTGAAREAETSPLSSIIQTLNTRFGTDFTEADRLLFEQVAEDLSADDGLAEQARSNPIEAFKLVFHPAALAAFLARKERNAGVSEQFMSNAEFRAAATDHLMREVWLGARRGPERAGAAPG
jgi:type I restriction enzyme R subunit